VPNFQPIEHCSKDDTLYETARVSLNQNTVLKARKLQILHINSYCKLGGTWPPVPTHEGRHTVKVERHCKKTFRRFAPDRKCPSTFKIAPAPMTTMCICQLIGVYRSGIGAGDKIYAGRKEGERREKEHWD